ncbi:MAG: phage holin family protein [Gaiellales bacterium]
MSVTGTGGGSVDVRRDESTGQLVKDLSQDISKLVRQELELAKAEMTQKGKRAGVGAGMLGGAGVFGVAVVGGSMATIILILDSFMPNWLAGLITTLAYAAVAAVLWLRGRDRLKEAGAPVPERAMESIKEDVEWAKTHAKSNGT